MHRPHPFSSAIVLLVVVVVAAAAAACQDEIVGPNDERKL